MIMREQHHLAEQLCLVEGVNVVHGFNRQRISKEGNEVDGDNRASAIAFSLLPSLPLGPSFHVADSRFERQKILLSH
jgi:hypothetical protein